MVVITEVYYVVAMVGVVIESGVATVVGVVVAVGISSGSRCRSLVFDMRKTIMVSISFSDGDGCEHGVDVFVEGIVFDVLYGSLVKTPSYLFLSISRRVYFVPNLSEFRWQVDHIKTSPAESYTHPHIYIHTYIHTYIQERSLIVCLIRPVPSLRTSWCP